MVLLIVIAIGAFAGGNPLSTTEGNEWNIKDHTQTQRDRGLAEALDDFGESSGQQPPRSEEDGILKLTLIYKADQDSIFTEENLRAIWEVRLVEATCLISILNKSLTDNYPDLRSFQFMKF